MDTVADLAAFSLKQEEALAACDARRAALLEIIDRANSQAQAGR